MVVVSVNHQEDVRSDLSLTVVCEGLMIVRSIEGFLSLEILFEISCDHVEWLHFDGRDPSGWRFFICG
jgi:hypothetical protein